jgi:hypothetical protein
VNNPIIWLGVAAMLLFAVGSAMLRYLNGPKPPTTDWQYTGRRRWHEVSRTGEWVKAQMQSEYVDFVSGRTEWRTSYFPFSDQPNEKVIPVTHFSGRPMTQDGVMVP